MPSAAPHTPKLTTHLTEMACGALSESIDHSVRRRAVSRQCCSTILRSSSSSQRVHHQDLFHIDQGFLAAKRMYRLILMDRGEKLAIAHLHKHALTLCRSTMVDLADTKNARDDEKKSADESIDDRKKTLRGCPESISSTRT
jgi:hypothetical protein